MIKKVFWKTAKSSITYWFIISLCLVLSCGQNYVPKPKGYPRIALPEKNYQVFDTNYPYSFEFPQYAIIVADKDTSSEPYWIDVIYPRFRGQLHVSYKTISKNLTQLTEDTRKFAMKHIPKASNIDEEPYVNESRRVFGIIYSIYGAGTASTYQFYLTDSSEHFLRGALYFNMAPNNDSLAPVIDFIKEDIKHMIYTFNWKSNF